MPPARPVSFAPPPTPRFSANASTKRAVAPPPINFTSPSLYFRAPETRALLRECLRTPERFDEALEYGFPRNNSISTMGTPALEPSSRKGSRPTIRLNESDEDVISSASDDEWPLTPGVKHYSFPTSTKRASRLGIQSGMISPGNTSTMTNADSYFGDAPVREMTLRLTLTKPELRASDAEIYGWQDDKAMQHEMKAEPDHDPLALEHLVFSDDTTGQFGAFAKAGVKDKGIKAFLRHTPKI